MNIKKQNNLKSNFAKQAHYPINKNHIKQNAYYNKSKEPLQKSAPNSET